MKKSPEKYTRAGYENATDDAKMGRLFSLALKEAKEEDLVRKHAELLPALREFSTEVAHIEAEIEASNPKALFAIRDAKDHAEYLKKLLLEKHPTLAGEADLQEDFRTLYELWKRLQEVQHSVVHSDHTPPERKS